MARIFDWLDLVERQSIDHVDRGPNVKRGEINMALGYTAGARLGGTRTAATHRLPRAIMSASGGVIMVSRRYLEQWLSVPGFEGLYEVSSCGRVRSLTALRSHGGYRPRIVPGRILKTTSMRKYPAVTLWPDEGPPLKKCVHVLVAAAFIPNVKSLPLVRHLDDDPTNNHAHNLAWGTAQDNADDKKRNGRAAKKLTLPEVIEIKTLLASRRMQFRMPGSGGLFKSIALEFGVSLQSIKNIHDRKTWAHA